MNCQTSLHNAFRRYNNNNNDEYAIKLSTSKSDRNMLCDFYNNIIDFTFEFDNNYSVVVFARFCT